MSTATNTNGWAPIQGAQSPIPPTLTIPLQSGAQVGRGQFCQIDANGNAGLDGGTVPNLVSAGVAFPEYLSDTSVATAAVVSAFNIGFGSGNPASTTANDGFLAGDWGTPFFIKDENTPGKLSNSGSNNRSLGGLVFGLDKFSNPRQWSGPIAHLLARATLLTNAKAGGWWGIADAAAATTAAETAIFREKLHGVVTNVEFIPTGNIAADATNIATLVIAKRNGAGGGASTVASYSTLNTSNGALTAFTTAQFTLATAAGVLNLLETDVLTIVETKGGSGQQLNGTVRVVQKVI